MHLRLWLLAIGLVGASVAQAQAATERTRTCAGCHAAHAEGFHKTGMGRAFFRAVPANMVEDFERNNTFFHEASGRYYRVFRRGDEYFLRRRQIGYGGTETNVVEKRIDYVMGSGNHVRSYIHRTAENRLMELPVSWYPENGGFFGMSPGYDHAGHPGFRRQISFDCMFCHNAYPEAPPGANSLTAEAVFPGELPEGIDCQRCHGPGGNHIAAARKGAPDRAAVRASIVNPARLSPERQMEVCMQCHLETTSFALPNSIQRPNRGTFSYQAGEPLEKFVLHFDHAPGSGRDDKFEIVNSVYRLRQSACFAKSRGKMVCTTCHNPHDVPRGEKAASRYSAVCQGCHREQIAARTAAGGHPAGE